MPSSPFSRGLEAAERTPSQISWLSYSPLGSSNTKPRAYRHRASSTLLGACQSLGRQQQPSATVPLRSLLAHVVLAEGPGLIYQSCSASPAEQGTVQNAAHRAGREQLRGLVAYSWLGLPEPGADGPAAGEGREALGGSTQT